MSRSPAILCSYIMRKYGIGFDEGYKLLRERRNVVKINKGFEKELQEYSAELKGEAIKV